jgi:5-methylcytosine-specific restriction endonuclease McrA
MCHLCGTDGATTADHRIPRSKGGTDTLANLRPAHHGCNSARGDRSLGEWYARHPLPTRATAPPSREW